MSTVGRNLQDQPLEQDLNALLWPPGMAASMHVYAVLDGARNPAIHPAIESSGLPYVCLYAGKIARPLIPVAPYLLQLHPEKKFSAWFLDKGWEDNFGIALLSSGSLEELRRHFRRFLKVQDTSGKSLLFRWYDPRVLRVYLPTCHEDELSAIFGPVTAFITPSGKAGTVLRFKWHGRGHVEKKSITLAPPG